MRIGIVTHRIVTGDGQGRVNYEVVCETIRRGYTATLFATDVAPELLAQGAVEHSVCTPFRYPTQLLKDFSFRRIAAKAVRRAGDRIDALMVNGAITSLASDVNVAHFVHGSWIKSPSHVSRTQPGAYGAYQFLYTWANARLEKAAFTRARRVVAVSDLVRDELLSIGVSDDKIVVIENGVDPNEFSPGDVDRAAIGLPTDAVVALFAGDIRQTRKNLDGVLRALVDIPGLHLAVAGDAKDSPFPALAQKLGVAERVRFLGFRTDLPDLCRGCDFFVLPSRYETFGLVVLEAMASGRPVVTAGTVGASALVAGGGYVIDNPEDIAALTLAMQKLAEDPELRRSMGSAARRIAEAHSFRRMAAHYVDLFEALTRVP